MVAKKQQTHDNDSSSHKKRLERLPYMQNRELSWLTFNKRVLDQGEDAKHGVREGFLIERILGNVA